MAQADKHAFLKLKSMEDVAKAKAKTANRKKDSYAYCRLTRSKFVIMRLISGSKIGWTKYAETPFESAAEQIVKILNKG